MGYDKRWIYIYLDSEQKSLQLSKTQIKFFFHIFTTNSLRILRLSFLNELCLGMNASFESSTNTLECIQICPGGPVGPPGLVGIPGEPGSPGEKGVKGFDGINGAKGETGAKGDRGISGTKGQNGQKGQFGQKGQAGSNGKRASDVAPGFYSGYYSQNRRH